MPTGCHWTQWAQESRSSGLLHSPCGAFRRGAWQRVITHTHTLCASHVCLFASRRAGWSILQGCNQGRLCNQYHHSGLENVLRAHSTLRSQRKRKGGWEKNTARKKTNAGRGSANGCKSQQACKQTVLFSHHTQNGSDSALSPHRRSLPLHHWLLRAVNHPAGSSLAGVWVGGPCAKGWRDNLPTVALMMLSRVPSINPPIPHPLP